VDGAATRILTAAQAERAGTGAWASFRGPEALIIDLAVGGDWPGPPNAATAFPAKMLVDYVKVNRRPNA
jgi:beta-glucanase (GH16 family)